MLSTSCVNAGDVRTASSFGRINDGATMLSTAEITTAAHTALSVSLRQKKISITAAPNGTFTVSNNCTTV